MKEKRFALSAAFAVALVGATLLPVAAQAAPPSAAGGTSPATDAAAPESEARSAVVTDGMSAMTTSHPEGGTWNYGTRGVLIKDTYSDYLHKSRKHGSSVIDGNGTTNRSSSVGAGKWSRSSVHHTFTGNRAYYRFT